MKILKYAFSLLVGILLVACQPAVLAEPAASVIEQPAVEVVAEEPEPSESPPVAVSWELELVAENLEIPWSLVFTNPERLLVSERTGQVREIRDGQLNPVSLYDFADSTSLEEAGLMGMALDPSYDENQYIYACYASSTPSGLVDKIVRLRDLGDRLEMDAVLMDDIPSAKYHAGCRIKFGPDGKLYITTGDALQPQEAQNLESLAGKILRVNPDGSIPQDNPFPGSAVYSYGHRNPQGIAWQPDIGSLFSTEHGPSGFDGPEGGDEINQILPGANYGWPLVSHDEVLEGAESPLIQFTPAAAPASAMFYDSDVLSMFNGNLFFGALRGEGLVRVVLSEDDERQINSVEWLVSDVGRVRDVAQGPDGLIYFVTSNRDGRGTLRPGDDKIYRLVPVYE